MDSAALLKVQFRCHDCHHTFDAEPERMEDRADRPWHPWAYFCACPACGAEAGQAPWEVGHLAAVGKQTGPKTEEGLAAVTQNLAGHPTPEETRRIRFNALKHGAYARTAQFFPARPGQYDRCEGCHYRDHGCGETAGEPCRARTELFMLHEVAFSEGKPELLTQTRAATHAMVQALIDDILLALAQDGVRLRAPKMYYDKDGACHVFRYTDANGDQVAVNEITAHPLLSKLIEILSKNRMTLEDVNMTPKVQDEHEAMGGYLDQAGMQQQNLAEFQKQTSDKLANIQGMIARSHEATKRDPILIEANTDNG